MNKYIKPKIRYSILPNLTRSILHILGGIVICLFFAAISITYTLTLNFNNIRDDLNDVSSGKRRYTMVDNFYDADNFYNFRQKKDNINILANFYNEFSNSSKITILSIFDQAIYLDNFVGDKKFYYNSDEFIETNKKVEIGIKSIQINNKAFEFYHLKLEDDTTVDWKNINFKKHNSIPIILGSGYKGVYNYGDKIYGNLYGKKLVFNVLGFLKENSYIYYKNDPEFYLDRYIIIPYPIKLWEVDKEDFQFEGILYFAMINCDLITNVNHRSFIDEVKRISNETYFSYFSIVNISDFLIKYVPLISIVKENTAVLYILMSSLYILLLFTLYGIGCIIISSKISMYNIFWIIGCKKHKKIIFVKLVYALLLSVFISVYVPQLYFSALFFDKIILLIITEIISFYFIYRLLLRYVDKKLRG